MQEEKGWKATGCRKGSAREGKEWLNLQGLDVGTFNLEGVELRRMVEEWSRNSQLAFSSLTRESLSLSAAVARV